MNKKKDIKIRLYIRFKISLGTKIILEKDQIHYVYHVMRAKLSDKVRLFNGEDGEWIGEITLISCHCIEITVLQLIKEQYLTRNLTLCFAPVKNIDMSNIIRQATEMGVTSIRPIYTEYTVVKNINLEKFKKWAIKASEQCERLDIPEIMPMIKFKELKELHLHNEKYVICDETGQGKLPSEVLKTKDNATIIIGPEGGFSHDELRFANSFCDSISLGPRILKVDTAIMCALSYVNEYYNLI
ncbi:16S rRNA (uracil(1498)-N(3))-methyltransferase [Neoehrlichia mikurensis]|uniref:Ribosomal RNA small subunit methyltransferase E n=1 Tax=Neoehrlichia mikurensis TaxID=89586 RepID=A0A9Q9BZJ7_9RICK|nr:16S rRNA (uracil(1498)-N(3))-methyltransferase [Neoehrlichia mikurensis]UTO55360.1 16S rRNA (uracil(1498)-N(3))-methyltransferase [Neoehrlichia mikurensis]UTO55365.1 16S rRNA (uracil(1498)-N(3))-methyltransferase [Neoehrlichia mikurensis]UTO56280.1 16S rRNA (uracil(1498)-N(3))-methyltransferase [Neoehrlichia mikurensis]UTO56285.1 16S rRNA (uracil(1498)-N(3))-methyltransferase [Neoehrlichia mikurensis]